MTDIATLALKIDSTDAKKAVDDLNKLGIASSKAEGSVNSAGKEWVRASSAAGKLRMESLSAASAEEKLASSSRQAGQAATQMAKDAQQAAAGLGAVSKVSGSTRAGMQQLGYQLGDIATMFSLGAKPMQIFASQGGQVVQAVQLMSGGTSRLAAFLGGPWGIAASVAAVALAPLIGKLFETADAADTARGRLQAAFDAFRNGLPQISNLSAVMTESTQTVLEAQNEIGRLQQKLAKVGGSEAYKAGTFLAQQIRAQEKIIADANGKVDDAIDKTRVLSWQHDRLAKQTEKTTTATNRHASAAGRAAQAIRAEAKASDQAEEAAKSHLTQLQKQIALYGKSPRDIRTHEITTLAAATANKELAQQLIDAGKALDALDTEKATKEYKDMIAQLERENELIGLVGPEREKAALALEEQGYKAKAAADGIQDVEAAWREYLRVRTEGIDKQTALDADLAKAELLNEQVGALVNGLGALGGAGGALGSIFSVLGSNNPIAALMGTGGAGLGIGSLLSLPFSFDALQAQSYSGLANIGNLLGIGLGDGLLNALSGGFAGAGIGAAVGGLGKSLGLPISSKGASIGGAAGGLAVALGAGPLSLITAPLAFGLLGGLFGGSTPRGEATIKGGSVSIEGNSGKREEAAGQAADGVISALDSLAEQLGGWVDNALGSVTISLRDKSWRVDPTGQGFSKTSNGAIDFGDDYEAAVAFAVKDLIEDGVLKGVRDSTMNILLAGDDFEAQLQKALSFEAVFAEIERQADPMKYELEQLAKQFAQLRTVFAEANATTAEYQQLADYQASLEAEIQAQYAAQAAAQAEANRLEALEAANAKLALEARLLAAQGDAVGALAKQREIELSQIDSANRALLQQVFQAEDIASAKQVLFDAYQRERSELEQTAAKMGQLGDTLRAFRDSVTGGGSSTLSYTQALSRLMQTGALASTGDETAIGNLPGVGRDFLSVARDRAGTLADYQRAQALVLGYTDKAIGFTDTGKTTAEAQLAAMETQVSALVDINENVITVAEAIERLTEVMGGGSGSSGTPETREERQERRREEWQARWDDRMDRMHRAIEAGTVASIRMDRRFSRWDRGGSQAISNDADEGLTVTA